MALTAKAQGDSDYEPIEQGMHNAVCCWIIDLGMQEGWQGKMQRKVNITWELPESRIQIPAKDGAPGEFIDKPRVCSKEFTLSLSERANLYKTLVSWRGRPFNAEELQGFDLKKVLGANCQIQIIHNPSKSDPSKIYSNIENVLPMPKGSTRAKPENELIFFSFEECQEGALPEIPEAIPDWIKDKIMKSDTWRQAENPHGAPEHMAQDPGPNVVGQDDNGNKIYEAQDVDEDVPF